MILSEKELRELADVIGEVEKKTTGELRLVIVGSSTPIGNVLKILFLINATVLTLVLSYVELVLEYHLLPLGLIPAGIASLLLAWLLARFPTVQRWVSSRADMELEVWERAELEFYREGLGATSGKTGILILLSLMEHQAVVLADKGISSKLDWNEVVGLVTEGARTKNLRPKLEEAIRKCGAILAQNFPATVTNHNELPNHVVVKL